LHWFLILFAVAIWNRDSAIFIALWLILDPLVRYWYIRHYKLPRIPLDLRRIVAGSVCIVVGLGLAELLKQYLLINETGPTLYPNSPIVSGRYNIVFLYNMEMLKRALMSFDYHFWFIIPAFWILLISLGLKFALLDLQRYLALYLVMLAQLAALIIFAWLHETRVYLVLVPFVVLFAVILPRSGPKTNRV